MVPVKFRWKHKNIISAGVPQGSVLEPLVVAQS